MRLILLLLMLTVSLPVSAVETKLTEEKTYCLRWANRFLSIKDGKNYRENKISAAKFPMYVNLCLENYADLRNYYQKLKKENHMKSIK